MTIDDFQALAEAWGADIARWPAARRSQALALAACEPAATAALARARALDDALATAPTLPPNLALQTRILADALGTRRAAAPRRWLNSLGAGAALAGACAAGALLGLDVADHQAQRASVHAAHDPADEAARILAEPADPAAG